MYTEWTNTILEAYEPHKNVIQGNIDQLLNEDAQTFKKEAIKKISKIWWVSLCAAGRGGILHPNNQEIDPNTLRTIAKAANIDVDELVPSILIIDSHMTDCNSGKSEPDGIRLYILPIYAIASAIDKSYDIDSAFKIPELDLFNSIGNIGVEALEVGGDAWTKIVYSTFDKIGEIFWKGVK